MGIHSSFPLGNIPALFFFILFLFLWIPFAEFITIHSFVFQPAILLIFQSQLRCVSFLHIACHHFFLFFPIYSLSFNVKNQYMHMFCVNWYIWFADCFLSSMLDKLSFLFFLLICYSKALYIHIPTHIYRIIYIYITCIILVWYLNVFLSILTILNYNFPSNKAKILPTYPISCILS